MRYGRTPKGHMSHIMQGGSIVTLCGVWLDERSDRPPHPVMCKTCSRLAEARS